MDTLAVRLTVAPAGSVGECPGPGAPMRLKPNVYGVPKEDGTYCRHILLDTSIHNIAKIHKRGKTACYDHRTDHFLATKIYCNSCETCVIIENEDKGHILLIAVDHLRGDL
jgi:hypothetical protein